MPAYAGATGFAVDDVTHTLRFERDLACSPQQAFEAWTQPEQISLWWDPAGAPLATCEINLEVGGRFTFISQDHPERPFVGSYVEIAAPNKLIFEAMGSVGRVILQGRGAETRMTVEITCSSEPQLKQFLQMGVATGTAQTLDNLVARMATAANVR